MATLYVSEFSHLYTEANGPGQMGCCPPLAEQLVSIGSQSAQAANAFGKATFIVRVHTDAICSIAFGPNPTAAANANMRLAANQTEYFGVQPGSKIAVITNS